MTRNGTSGPKAWLPVAGLTLCAFVFNTSEFVPIGLLSDIAADFAVTETRAGMLITGYAWVVAVASLPLMLLFSKTGRRRLLFAVLSLFVVSHLLSAVAASYGMLMCSRMGVACAHALFWSIASPLAVRIAPPGRGSAALGMVVTGTAVAMIAGLPLGRVVGLYAGWRMTFLAIGGLSAAILLFLALVFPRVPGHPVSWRGALRSIGGNRALGAVYLLTIVSVTAHYTGYSYVEPFLAEVAAMTEGGITWTLVLFGAAGIVGSGLFSRFFDRAPSRFIGCAFAGVALALAALRPLAFHPAAVMSLCALWGIAFLSTNLVLQAEVIRLAPDASAVAMSIFSGLCNVGIGGGALIGGAVCSELSVAAVGYAGGAIALGALAVCFGMLLPRLESVVSPTENR